MEKHIIGHYISKVVNKYENRFDPYDYYKNYILDVKSEPVKYGNILITPIVGAYGHLFEGLYARKATLSGKQVHILRCNKAVKYCDIISSETKYKLLRCEKCLAEQDDFVKAFNCIEHTLIRPNSDQHKEIESFISSFFEDVVDKKHFFHDVEIDRVLYSSLQKYYFMASPEIKNDIITRGYLYTVAVTILTMEKLCDEIRPDYVLTSHGTYSIWGSILEFCKSRNIFIVTHGITYNHCGIGFMYNDSCLTSEIDDKDGNWERYLLKEHELIMVKGFLDERAGRTKDDKVTYDYNRNNKKHFNRAEIAKMLNVDPTKKIVGVFPNIPWDGDMCSGAVVFKNFKEWLVTTVEFFKNREDVVLVIRPHPAEKLTGTNAGRETISSLLKLTYECLPSNIVLLEADGEINSYTLGENCDFGIAYASTIALELLYLNVPIIIAGCPQYKDKNVGFDISSLQDYYDLIEKGIKGVLRVDDDRHYRLLQFMFYFYFKKTMPQTIISSNDAIPTGFMIKTEKELSNNPVMAELYKGIDSRKELDFSRFY